MKQILILIILSSILFGCRTKVKSLSITKELKTEAHRIKLDSVKEIFHKEDLKKLSDQNIKKKQEEFSGDIIIKGKSDSINPLIFHNVVGKDTLQSITIKGNADFQIKNHYKKSTEESTNSKKEESTNIIQDLAKAAVSKETISDVASALSNKTNDIKSKGFQAGGWIVFAVLGAVAIIMLFIFIYFKKNKK